MCVYSSLATPLYFSGLNSHLNGRSKSLTEVMNLYIDDRQVSSPLVQHCLGADDGSCGCNKGRKVEWLEIHQNLPESLTTHYSINIALCRDLSTCHLDG